jgi:hypothetical protein
MTKEGDVIWRTSVPSQYTDVWSEYVTADSLAVNSGDCAYVLAKHNRFQYRWVLYKFDADGSVAWNRTVLGMNWMNLWDASYGNTKLLFGDNGLLYMGGLYAPTEDTPYHMAVTVFNPDDAPLPVTIPPILLPLAIGVGVIVVATLVYRLKRKA